MVKMAFNMAQWLSKSLENSVSKNDFYSFVREGHRIFFTQRLSNSRGRYMAVSEYGDGRRRNSIILEDKEGQGWSKMASQLREVSSTASGSKPIREVLAFSNMVAQQQQMCSSREALKMGQAGMEYHGGEERRARGV